MPKRRTLELKHLDEQTGRKVYEKKIRTVPPGWKKGVNLRNKMAECLRNNGNNVAAMCDSLGITRAKYNYHLREYPEFRARVDHIRDAQIDLAEQYLFEQMANGNSSATQFFLKTQGANRGYTERTEHKESREINVNFSYDVVKSDKLKEVQEIMEAEVVKQQQMLEDGEDG